MDDLLAQQKLGLSILDHLTPYLDLDYGNIRTQDVVILLVELKTQIIKGTPK